MSGLLLKGINKVYPSGVQAVFNFCLDIRDKEFIVLVGPFPAAVNPLRSV